MIDGTALPGRGIAVCIGGGVGGAALKGDK